MVRSVLLLLSLTPFVTADAFHFDINDGVKKQQESDALDAEELIYTTGGGTPVQDPYSAQRIGSDGPLLLQDFHLIESLAHFARERIPERVVHAKAAGAHGYFETTTTTGAQYSVAGFLQKVGTRTPLTARFSTVGGEVGSSDVARDPRGFALKLRTQEGILDWVFNNTPVFFLRDPARFPNFIHTQKRNPQTHTKDKDMFWDYLSSSPESLHQVLRLFSDLGTPYGMRFMNGYSGHAYRAVRADGSWNYVKIKAVSDQGIRNHTAAEADRLAGSDPDFGTRDLFDAIESGNFPCWTVYIQVLSPSEAETFKHNVLDLTKDWHENDVPSKEIGKICLTQNPTNYFAEIEQAAFSPSHTVEGFEPSADPVLQARLFSYPDAHRYRLGVNYQQLPVNCPLNPVASFQRDGFMAIVNQGSRPNYPSTQDEMKYQPPAYDSSNHTIWIGGAVRSLSKIDDSVDWDWPRIFYNELSEQDKANLISNIAGHLGGVKSDEIKTRQLDVFAKVTPDFASAIARSMNYTYTPPS